MIKKIYGDRPQSEILGEIVSAFKKADEKEYCTLYNKYIPFFWVDRSPYTARNLYQDVLKEIGKQKIPKNKKDALNALFTLSNDFYTVLNNASHDREQAKENTEFSIDGYLAKMMEIKENIKNKTYKGKGGASDAHAMAVAMCVYVAMATGRRTYEILKTVDLFKEKKEVYFIGIAKKGDDDNTPFPAILLDDDVTFIKKCLNHIRDTFNVDGMDSKKINSKYSGMINNAVARYVGEEGVSMHTLRERYADICVKTKPRPMNMDDATFSDFVLSHEIRIVEKKVIKSSDFYNAQKGV